MRFAPEADVMPDPSVLIVGAGPTGLVLALWWTRLGVRVRIIDKAAEPGTTSRALVVHARTLEFYRQIGLADAVVQQCRRFAAGNLWVKGRLAGRVGFGPMGEGVSPYPYMLIFPQDEHERLLIDRLAEAGVTVERPVELVAFTENGNHVRAQLRHASGAEESCRVAYIAGCDGAHSTVRGVMGVGFPGGTYERLFYVADVAATGPVMNGDLNIALDEADFLAVFPLKDLAHARLIGTVREEEVGGADALGWDDVSHQALDRLQIQIERVNWFSTYRVHHRVAEKFQRGRAFLLGDAAHIHSPVGGQGMNTGIGDAVNLAWKLAEVIQGRAAPALLDTYEPERIAFARRLVATTDRAFTIISSTGRFARFVRAVIAPRLLPLLFRSKTVRRFMFRVISQTSINYRHSPLSVGSAGKLKAGDRLPWVLLQDAGGNAADNFAALSSLDWQVHIYGVSPPEIADLCRRCGLAIHVYSWSSAAASAGLVRDALYLIRPDGYIGLVDPEARPAELRRYLESTAAVMSDAVR
jgi:2-polyprenyl-6-methoxyphenol hydroxylase-like FAD-dependent oxidoreductase